ncbi:hypothetical protein E1212_06455 [Jiangella ureilytica]|uniref:Ricin B lectin domain-containing protein n=1 Tax=Jiangella ureilytica TaxID=2530374 RepID=A0A4R4RXE7_9ACTN|nr:hypothetical protein E1212_06455 [Jiangella ureilytica]
MLAKHDTAGPHRPWRTQAAAILAVAAIPAALLTQTATAAEPPKATAEAAPADQAGELIDESPGQIPLTGSVSLHDPTLWKDDDTYYVSATGGLVRSAPSLEGPWTNLGSVPAAGWAPHVQRIEDTYYYYYSSSSFGTNNSSIRLKTTKTPDDPASYVERGTVIRSGSQDPGHATFNAIDGAIWPDENGDWWIVWGSHFDGIMIQQLGEDMVSVVGERRMIAHRESDLFPILTPGCPYPQPSCPNFNRIEGPSIFEKDGYFYLMAAWDWCCRANGNDNTYKIIVGRSENIYGPYVDKNGVDLAEGGGSIILNSRVAAADVTPSGLYRAPGGADIFVEDDVYHLVYHAYRPQNTLGIWPMSWHDGWPYLNEPDGGPYDLQDGAHYRLVNQDGSISDPNSLQNPVVSDRCLTADDRNVIQAHCDDSAPEQIWEMHAAPDGTWRLRGMGADGELCLAMADDSGEIATDVVTAPCDESSDLQRWNLDDTGHGFHRAVSEGTNLAVEIENVCDPAASYNCDGDIGTDVVGGIRRDGDHTAGNLTQAAKWPPQQWRFTRVDELPCFDVVTGRHAGPMTISHGVTCLDGATVNGPITVAAGAGLRSADSRVSGPVRATDALEIEFCGSRITGPVTIAGGARVALGSPQDGCDGNMVTGPVSVTGVRGVTVIADNRISGPLACSDNEPAPVDQGFANVVRGPTSGQCDDL